MYYILSLKIYRFDLIWSMTPGILSNVFPNVASHTFPKISWLDKYSQLYPVLCLFDPNCLDEWRVYSMFWIFLLKWSLFVWNLTIESNLAATQEKWWDWPDFFPVSIQPGDAVLPYQPKLSKGSFSKLEHCKTWDIFPTALQGTIVWDVGLNHVLCIIYYVSCFIYIWGVGTALKRSLGLTKDENSKHLYEKYVAQYGLSRGTG